LFFKTSIIKNFNTATSSIWLGAKNIDTTMHIDIIMQVFEKLISKMIKNIIDQIKESEEQAKGIIASSKKESAAIIEKAYQQANKKISDAEIRVKKLSFDAEAQAVEDVKVEKVKLEEEYAKKKGKLLKAFSAREEKAIGLLVSRVLD